MKVSGDRGGEKHTPSYRKNVRKERSGHLPYGKGGRVFEIGLLGKKQGQNSAPGTVRDVSTSTGHM